MSMQGGKTASKDDDEDVAMEGGLAQKMTETENLWREKSTNLRI